MTGRGVLMVAGEASGDLHGGNLLVALRTLDGAVAAWGVGGERMRAAGLECLEQSGALSHMGLAEVVRELPAIRVLMRRLVAEAERRAPRVAVLIDSPDFNLRLARRLARRGIPVVLYVSPQLWAWRRGRVRTIRRVAREVLCLLPFEPAFYHQHGVRARHVGHPLVDDLASDGLLDVGVQPVRGRLALLPGSRAMEVRSLLPAMVQALAELPATQIQEAVLLEAPGLTELVGEVLTTLPGEPRLRRVSGPQRRPALAASAVAWSASGTATLECALLGVPMVVGYRLHPVTFMAARLLVRVPHVALVNLIAGRRAVPELLQHDWAPANLAAHTSAILADGGAAQQAALALVRERLGGPGASLAAARAVAEYLR